jgi:hypothetical protein
MASLGNAWLGHRRGEPPGRIGMHRHIEHWRDECAFDDASAKLGTILLPERTQCSWRQDLDRGIGLSGNFARSCSSAAANRVSITGGECPVNRLAVPEMTPHRRTVASPTRQDPSGKPGRVSSGDEPRPVGVVVRHVVDALVIFTQGQDAQEELAFVLCSGPSLDGRRAVRVDDRADHIGVEKPADHSSASRP